MREQLERDGYAVVPDLLSVAELDRLRAETAAHLNRITDGTAQPLVREENGIPFRVENIAAHPLLDRSVLAARMNPRLLELMAEAIDPDVISYGSVMVFKLPSVGPAVPMHRDIAEGVFSAGHLWFAAGVYLDDANLDNGCLWVVPRSHRLSGADLAAASAFGLDHPDAVAVPVRAGSVLLHDSRLLHGSRPSAGGGLRRVLYHSYQSARWMLDEGLKRSFHPDEDWIAASFALMRWGSEQREVFGYGDEACRWSVPVQWREPTSRVVPRDDLAVIRYRVTDS